MKILRLPEVLSRVGYRRSKVYALIKENKFPKPLELGAKARGFVESEVDAWIAERIRERDERLEA
jgi:prophage regulatory protein